MPRETIHYGHDFATIFVNPEDDRMAAYSYEVAAEEARLRTASGAVPYGDVEFDTKPRLDLIWGRPEVHSLPVGEEPKGYVQVSIALSPTSMTRRIEHIADHPEDLEEFSIIYTESLTRTEINQMIRHLKRARDAAFGADE